MTEKGGEGGIEKRKIDREGREGGIEKRKIDREGRGEKGKKVRRDDTATPPTHIPYYTEYARFFQLDY